MKGSGRKNRSGELIRGFLVFLVAFLLGVSVTLGAIVGGIYAALAYVTIDTLDGLGITFADRFLEEDSALRHLSVIGMVGEIMTISGNLSATTFNSLMQQYGVIVSDDVRDYIPDGLVDLPFSEFAGNDAAHVLLSHITFGDVFKISGEVMPGALSDKLTTRTLDLAFEKKLDKLFEGIYLGDVIDVALEVRDDGLVHPIVAEGERPRVVDYFGTLDLGEFFAAKDKAGKDAVLNATLARVPLADMMAEDDSMFGDAIDGKTLGDLVIIENLSFLFSMEPLLDDLYLGNVLGYHRVYDEDGVTLLYWADKNERPAKGLYRELVDLSVNELGDTDIMSRIDNVYVAELMDYDRVEEIDAETGETVYRFYKCDADGNWLYDEHGDPIEPSGMTADLAVLTVGELRDEDTLNEEIRDMQIGTVMGYTLDDKGIWRNESGDAAQGVMRPLLGSTVGSLDEDMDKLYLGQVMGFDILRNEDGLAIDKDGNVIEDENGVITGEPVFMKDGDNDGKYDNAELDTHPGALMAEFVSLKLADIDDESQFTARVKEVRVGDAMGYTKKDDGKWYQKNEEGDLVLVTGIFAALADSKVNELDGSVQELSVADALGYEKSGDKWLKDGKDATGLLRVLMEKGANLNNISDTSKEIELGEIMDYTKTDAGYEKDGVLVSGIVAEFVDLTLADLESDTAITNKINNMALGTAMGYTYDEKNDVWLDKNNTAATGFMKLIGPGTTIVELDDAIAKLKTPEKGSIQALIDAEILELDDTTIAILDDRLDGWKEMSINTFINSLIGLLKPPQQQS